jgi:membrane protease subunit HflC
MNRKNINLAIGLLLMVLFLALLVTFQVRQTELAIVTTFGKVTSTETTPGLKWKLPWPIQRVHYLDRRLQNFDSMVDEVQTSDGRNLLVGVYAGWSIAAPEKFFPNFGGGSLTEATKRLDEVIRSKKNETVGQHPLSHFISTDEKELKFAEIENEILAKVKKEALSSYGIDVQFVRIKRLNLPGSITEKVFARMQKERQRLVQQFVGEGEARAIDIQTAAQRDRAKLLAEARSEVSLILGDAESQAGKALAVFEQKPDLAVLLLKLKALEQSLQERTTLILDQQTPPFDLMRDTNAPISLR